MDTSLFTMTLFLFMSYSFDALGSFTTFQAMLKNFGLASWQQKCANLGGTRFLILSMHTVLSFPIWRVANALCIPFYQGELHADFSLEMLYFQSKKCFNLICSMIDRGSNIYWFSGFCRKENLRIVFFPGIKLICKI